MKKAIYVLLILLILPRISLAAESDLVISEIMYDWPGADSGHEWVEIYNAGTDSVVVMTGSSGWRFFDGSNHILTLSSGNETIAAGQYFVIADNAAQFVIDYPSFGGTIFDSSFSLSNSSDQIGLSFDSGSTPAVSASYESVWGAAGDGNTLEKIVLNQDSSQPNWQVSAMSGGTPGAENSSGGGDLPIDDPVAVASCPSELAVGEVGVFDANSSQNILFPADYLWSFGDQSSSTSSTTEHAYQAEGVYEIHLQISMLDQSVSDDCQVSVSSADDNGGDDNGGGSDYQNPPSTWADIKISEIMPNPLGSDTAEWIELYNNGSTGQDLAGFALQDNSTRVYTFDEQIISAGQYLLIYKNQSSISLNNTGGDQIKLYNPDGDTVDQVSYADTAAEGKSLARRQSTFEWTVEPSPGSANVFPENQPPVASIKILSEDLSAGEKIVLSAEQSSDPEEGELSYLWDFGDEQSGDEKKENHVYEGAGQYQVRLLVTDQAGLSSEDTMLLDIKEVETDISLEQIQVINFLRADLIISEVLPDPDGSDDSEWVEIYNASDADIDLIGWQIDDEEGGSKPFVIKESKKIAAKSFLIIEKSESKLTLNNSNDSVRILTPLGELWQEFAYTKTATAKSWAWDFENHEWFEADPSPGTTNIFISSVEESVAAVDLVNLNKNSSVLFQGIALQDAATSSRSLYIADVGADGWQAVEIYSSKKEWPKIVAGDALEVSGFVSIVEPVTRIKITSADNIKILGHRQPVEADQYLSAEVSEELLGKYIKVKGIVSKKSGKNIYLSSDDDQQVRVYYSGSATDLEVAKDDEIIVSGVLLPSPSNLKLLVLSRADILTSKTVLGDKQSGELSQDQINMDNSVVKVQVPGNSALVKKYLWILLFVFMIVPLAMLWKKHKKKESI